MGLLIEELDFLREINLWTVILRLLLAVLCGGVVGMEREVHGRAAGLRTHMMVAVGAALTTLIGVFSLDVLEVTWADPMRIGAQVISGIGFLGAGTILLKRGNPQITGLTTAAGLWVTAVIGLAVGAGFYEGAVLTALVSLLIFTLVSKLEFLMNSKRQRLFVYIEIDDVNVVSAFADRISSSDFPDRAAGTGRSSICLTSSAMNLSLPTICGALSFMNCLISLSPAIIVLL